MRLAIHKEEGSFSDHWVDYCENKHISYKIVNCYDSDIISQLNDCEGLLWHWNHNDYRAALCARQLTLSLEKSGVKVFPDVNTAWHFDDKVGQKYLLEAVNAPLVKSHVFYTKLDALKWLNQVTFPKVFKLRGGAGAVNVSLVKNKAKGRQLINKAFGKGFSHINRLNRLKDRVWELKRDKDFAAFKKVLTGLARIFIPTEVERYSHNEKGYIYFQDFIPDNDSDIRLVVVGERCFGMRRYCRDGDFKASGSGLKSFDPSIIGTECVKIAFEVAQKLNLQSVAFDFIKNGNNYQIIEISYCFVSTQFPGFWDKTYKWHSVVVSPQFSMVEDFMENLKIKQ
ncbi:RimK family alpha-L-glutamate ligase [Ancylomarina sp. 16SWW S1-10-2]|uniref:ATP-grasp domain-containing protein n=1 Tax=Ancylomarina sp. 16SWW S1-10-2 TaxID=2499681 RepID=UPI0012AE96EC|nr:hypothetical protein [Ancylomarina sp. 16SWW S1-10-2]MRT91927.1 hypothetical protein [Ancylomarina sp. 16SWW S1-10-2]